LETWICGGGRGSQAWLVAASKLWRARLHSFLFVLGSENGASAASGAHRIFQVVSNEVLPGDDNGDAVTLTLIVICFSFVGRSDDVAVFTTELVHELFRIIEGGVPGLATADDGLVVDLGGQVVVGETAKLDGAASGSMNDAAEDVLLAINFDVGMATLEERNVKELVGGDVLVEVAEALLDDGVPVSGGLLDVVEALVGAGGVVSEPHDLVLEAHDVFSRVGEGNDLAAGLGEVLGFLGLCFPGLGLGKFTELELVKGSSVLRWGTSAVEDYNKRLAILLLSFAHGDADNLIALELLWQDPVESLVAVGGHGTVGELLVIDVSGEFLRHLEILNRVGLWYMFNIVVLLMGWR
jgi:hypothetical protein